MVWHSPGLWLGGGDVEPRLMPVSGVPRHAVVTVTRTQKEDLGGLSGWSLYLVSRSSARSLGGIRACRDAAVPAVDDVGFPWITPRKAFCVSPRPDGRTAGGNRQRLDVARSTARRVCERRCHHVSQRPAAGTRGAASGFHRLAFRGVGPMTAAVAPRPWRTSKKPVQTVERSSATGLSCWRERTHRDPLHRSAVRLRATIRFATHGGFDPGGGVEAAPTALPVRGLPTGRLRFWFRRLRVEAGANPAARAVSSGATVHNWLVYRAAGMASFAVVLALYRWRVSSQRSLHRRLAERSRIARDGNTLLAGLRPHLATGGDALRLRIPDRPNPP